MNDDQKLFFDGAVAGLFHRALAGKISPALKTKLRDAGIDLDKPLLPAYPARVFRACVQLAAEELMPDDRDDERHYQMGRLAVSGFARDRVGEPMFEYLKVISGERSALRMQQNLRAAMNFIEVKARQLDPQHVELTLNDTIGMPHFFRGLVEGGSIAAGRAAPEVTMTSADGPGCVLSFRLT